MMTSLRKSFREVSAPSPDPKFQTLLAQNSNSLSCVTPRSRVMASYFVRPGDRRLVLGSPPSRCSTTSVVRLRALTLLIPATGLPSHKRRNLKFLYGSSRRGEIVVPLSAILTSLYCDLPRHLLQLDNHKLSRLKR